MSRGIMKGIIAGGILGATVSMYAINNMSLRRKRAMMRSKRRILGGATSIMKGFNIF